MIYNKKAIKKEIDEKLGGSKSMRLGVGAIFDAYRAYRRTLKSVADDDPTYNDRREFVEWVDGALSALEGDEGEAIGLRYVKNLRTKQCIAMMNVAESTFHDLTARGLNKLCFHLGVDRIRKLIDGQGGAA